MGTSKQPVTLVHEARFTEGGEAEGAAGVKSRLGGGGAGTALWPSLVQTAASHAPENGFSASSAAA